MDQQTWRKVVKRLISTQMKKRDVKYEDLSQRLAKLGIKQSASNLGTKVSNGVLGADLLLAILFALDFKHLAMEDISDVLEDLGVDLSLDLSVDQGVEMSVEKGGEKSINPDTPDKLDVAD